MGKGRRSVSYQRSITVHRREWKESLPDACMYCKCELPPTKLDVHEIERKSHSPNRWWKITDHGKHVNGLKLCRQCHTEHFDTMPHAKQLAVKLIEDPDNFDLDAWLSIKPRPSTYVTMSEVMEHVKELI